MEDKSLPKSIGPSIVKPISFPDEDELCRRLDEFYRASGIKLEVPPSHIFRGALYALRREYSKENPDWMSQVAHSLREILYQFDRGNKKRKHAFEQYGSTYDEKKRIQDVGRYYNFITDIAHHNIAKAAENPLIGGSKDKPVIITREVFENAVFQFGKIIYAVLRRQLDAHREIDRILEKNPNNSSISDIESLIELNPDARKYFYFKADEQWLDWLWENEFLDVIKQKAEDPTRYGYRTPELNYLVRMADKAPSKAVDIMLKVPISPETFNPEVVDQFLQICSILAAEQLARVVQKIRNEKWVPLMGTFNQWGFEYEKMLKTLADAKDYKSILILAEAILALSSNEEMEKTTGRIVVDNPFYFDGISNTKVIEHIANVDDDYAEQALALVTKVMAGIVLLGSKAKSGETFPIRDIFHLFDVDFFTLELGKKDRLSYRNDVRELIAIIKVLANRLIGKRCAESGAVRKLYENYIATLPQSRVMWRLRLFFLSLCPEVFKDELKIAFFRLFEVDRYYEIISGTEYEKALQKGFSVLAEDDKHEYVKRVIVYFKKRAEDKKDQDWHTRYGSGIFSMVADHLTEEERQQVIKAGFKLDSNYEPRPRMGPIRVGSVVPKGPMPQEEFGKLPIPDIAQKLRIDWTPEKLVKQNTRDDFKPLNAEGVGEQLRADITMRLQDYVNNASLFFERDVLNQHYTCSFLRGIQEAIRADKSRVLNIQWDRLIELFITIKKSGEEKAFDHKTRERDTFGAWLSDWTEVHRASTDVLQELLKEDEGRIAIDFSKFRNQPFDIINYLLGYNDPEPKDEELETAVIKTQSPGDKENLVGDPFTIAINTVRGQAFETFVLFVYQDGKKFTKDKSIKVSSDVKKLYETVLQKENTRALMFMFGHYLPSFYYRDKEWIRKLLPQIFPEASDKKHLYLAAWEGYLANNLYKEIFVDSAFQELYERGLDLTDIKDPNREYFKDPDESIAVHLALAFMHYEEFCLDHSLLRIFWGNNNSEQHAAFVSFLGRMFVSGDNAIANELLEEEQRSRQRLRDLWDWILESYEDKRPFVEFGFWISLEKDIFEPAWLAGHVKKTLEKTNGFLDWGYGLKKSIIRLAEASPKDTLEIARLYLLEGGIRGGRMRMPYIFDDEWFKTFKILHSDPATTSGTYTLINDLIREGGSIFWKLKNILNE